MLTWSTKRKSVYTSNLNQVVFRIGRKVDVEDVNGRYWAASYQDGTHVQSEDLGLPYEGIHRFSSLKDAQWYMETHDTE